MFVFFLQVSGTQCECAVIYCHLWPLQLYNVPLPLYRIFVGKNSDYLKKQLLALAD
jgi:hypothetical protein